MKPARSLSIIVGGHTSGCGGGGGGPQAPGTTDADNNNNNLAARGHHHHHPAQQHQHHPAHRLQAQYSMPCSLNSRRAADATYQLHHSLFDEQIVYCQLSIASKKDFNEEVRALLDVRKFVADSFILMGVQEVRIGAIVEEIVDRLVECRQLGAQVADEAKTQLFVDRSSLSMVLANTMQGLYKSRADGRLAYDHSWIVATCSLASLTKRQVAISRFAQPVNFGRQSQEVRFLIVVLAPSKEKLTKSAWETGRTFATIFTDIGFRRRLLRAKTQDEFKAELLVKAETLAREGADGNAGAGAGSGSGSPPDHLADLDYQQQAIGCRRHCSMAVGWSKPAALGGGGGGGGHNHSKLVPFDLSLCGPAAHASDSRSSSTSKKHKKEQKFKSNKWAGGPKEEEEEESASGTCCAGLASGLLDDLRRRARHYASDYLDGVATPRSVYKTVSTTVFLYFSVLLPCIAFGVVDTNNTDGHIDPKKTMIGQAIGGLLFALFSGQPLIVVMTTAPLCIYVKVIYQIALDLEADFGAFYACVGLWMALFLAAMSLSNASNLMRYCTRSTEDIFALFTAFAFGSDGIKEAIRSFNKYYWEPDCLAAPAQGQGAGAHQAANETQHLPLGLLLHYSSNSSGGGGSSHLAAAAAADQQQQHHSASELSAAAGWQHPLASRCQRETCILFLFLMSGTLFLANSFSSFHKTPYLSSRKREIIKDYALAFSVLIFSFIGSYLFQDIRLDVFEFADFTGLHLAPLGQLGARHVWFACPLGFALSVLFYIDQNICGAMVNNAPYKLKKGDYFHLDLLVLALINALLSLTGLPWMHGKLPHSHLHSKALADYEERVDDGHVQQMIVNIRETRLTGLLCSLLIAGSLLAVPYPLSYVPLPVLSGVFLYTALAELKSNSMVERVCLLFTEQAAYPPNHYIRRCPQRKIHFFTLAQLAQLAVVSLVGFYPNPYVNMAFPLVVATFVPLRERLLPKLIDSKYLSSLDSQSMV